MTIQELERRRRQSARDADYVRSFREWCEINGFSLATGRRILASGKGPKVIQLSPRRIGIRDSDNLAWQESRAREQQA
jgi:predicted DNA-binding transcriptional regulator AlpA